MLTLRAIGLISSNGFPLDSNGPAEQSEVTDVLQIPGFFFHNALWATYLGGM